jgi:hypothetical protein
MRFVQKLESDTGFSLCSCSGVAGLSAVFRSFHGFDTGGSM